MHVSSYAPTRPALRFYGGKWKLAPWIIGWFPRTHEHYVEPYGGAGSVLLRKPRSFCETYNDLNRRVVAFFHVLRERPDELVHAISLTPYALAEYTQSLDDPDPIDPLEAARRFYVRAMQGRSGPGAKYRSGWRRWKTPAGNAPPSLSWTRTTHLYQVAKRLMGVQIENEPALNIIARYDSPITLFYLDPPYPTSARSQQWGNGGYVHEMSDKDHVQLAEVLHDLCGMVLISGYPCDLYTNLYADWHMVTTESYTDNNIQATEALWISPAAKAAYEAELPPAQALLFQQE